VIAITVGVLAEDCPSPGFCAAKTVEFRRRRR
jgi:hypothetical protein